MKRREFLTTAGSAAVVSVAGLPATANTPFHINDIKIEKGTYIDPDPAVPWRRKDYPGCYLNRESIVCLFDNPSTSWAFVHPCDKYTRREDYMEIAKKLLSLPSAKSVRPWILAIDAQLYKQEKAFEIWFELVEAHRTGIPVSESKVWWNFERS